MREIWRELARLITFFDLCSPSILVGSKIGEFFRKSAPDRTRTCDPRLRRPVLYPTELRAHTVTAISVIGLYVILFFTVAKLAIRLPMYHLHGT